jgi:hypothetical protein
MIPPEILEFIEKRFIHRIRKKDLYGEVFSPIELIDELVAHIPVKWAAAVDMHILDPTSGIGNFSVVIYYKLMESLKEVIPDKTKRSLHIIENILYMVEIDKTNVSQCQELFKIIEPTAKPNICHCDFLEEQELLKNGILLQQILRTNQNRKN